MSSSVRICLFIELQVFPDVNEDIDEPVLTSETYPCDLDSTAIGFTVTKHVGLDTKMSVMDEMATYVNEDGIIQTYFDRTRPRIGE